MLLALGAFYSGRHSTTEVNEMILMINYVLFMFLPLPNLWTIS
jgi:hypothetical protein